MTDSTETRLDAKRSAAKEGLAVGELFGTERRTLFPFDRAGTPGDQRPEVERVGRIALMRTRLLREMRERGWTRLAIVPVTKGAGATTIALELAWAILRQEGVHVTLADLDFADPAIARHLETEGSSSVRLALRRGEDLGGLVLHLADQPNLAVLAPAAPEDHPAELLQSARFIDGLDRLHDQLPADYVIYDMAPLLGNDVGLSALPLADAILLVADGTATVAADIRKAEKLLVDQPPLMGVILNKSEK
ncbi:P-loop NTPase family protein [Paracoccus aminophilus]|uniref:CpsD/CapB family tyrosine-protein kinase n=1 Tax=Paracoccus aminophilus TaxID=34003 RepID=UPI0011DE108F|nr:CpsD/CapB family tyrosine-protein kinase [Paracoccus aminophilus]